MDTVLALVLGDLPSADLALLRTSSDRSSSIVVINARASSMDAGDARPNVECRTSSSMLTAPSLRIFSCSSLAHDLRRTCARPCHLAGGELDQIQFLLGHVSIQTTDRVKRCRARCPDGRSRGTGSFCLHPRYVTKLRPSEVVTPVPVSGGAGTASRFGCHASA